MNPATDTGRARYDATDVPALRRGLADWYGSAQGVNFYLQAIQLGRQPIRPPGPPDKVAHLLAAAETTRLRDGDLWYIDENLCALLNAAHPSMPAFAPRPQDLPSKVGFAVFADPIAVYAAQEARDDQVVELLARSGGEKMRQAGEQLYAGQAPIVAVSWSPVTNPHWPAGGLWMSFYAASGLHEQDVFTDPKVLARARGLLPPLTVDNEACLAWRPDGYPVDEFQLPGPDAPMTTLSWARLVFAAFQLAAQANLAESEQLTTARPERRRTERAGLPPRDVRVARLRRTLSADRDSEADRGDREWRHRWVVRGHWRKHWYPSLNDHRPLWIAPYLKGPADAPLIGGDKVTIINTPPTQREGQ
ncbi:hypothetical protein ACIBSS_27990 [Micromonospora aurantiaca]|uniref:hypothetical protein n=1 Tax=Micromonospora aurantiaca (nom. illeg.) TaxID=47850 RepID=UPI00378C068A